MEYAEIYFNSSCDFEELTMNLIEEQDVNPNFITLNIKLQPAANAQLMQVSRNNINHNLTMYINGLKVNTATVRNELNSGVFRAIVDKMVAQKLFSGLLSTKCAQ